MTKNTSAHRSALILLILLLIAIASTTVTANIWPYAANRTTTNEACWNDGTNFNMSITTSHGVNVWASASNTSTSARLLGRYTFYSDNVNLSQINPSNAGFYLKWPDGTEAKYDESGYATEAYNYTQYTSDGKCYTQSILSISNDTFIRCFNITAYWMGEAFVRDINELTCSDDRNYTYLSTGWMYTYTYGAAITNYNNRDDVVGRTNVALLNGSYFLNAYLDESYSNANNFTANNDGWSYLAGTGLGRRERARYELLNNNSYNAVKERFIFAFSPNYIDVIPRSPHNYTVPTTWNEGDFSCYAASWTHWNINSSNTKFWNSSDYLWPALKHMEELNNMGLENCTYMAGTTEIFDKNMTEAVPFDTSQYNMGHLCNQLQNIGYDCTFYYSPQDSYPTYNKYNESPYIMQWYDNSFVGAWNSSWSMRYNKRGEAIANLYPNMSNFNITWISLDTLVNHLYLYMDFNASTPTNSTIGGQYQEQTLYLKNITNNITHVYCEECNDPFYVAGLVFAGESGTSTSGNGWSSNKFFDETLFNYNPIMRGVQPYYRRWDANVNAAAAYKWHIFQSRMTYSLQAGLYPFIDNTADWKTNATPSWYVADYFAHLAQLPYTIAQPTSTITYRNASGNWHNINEYIKTNSTPTVNTTSNKTSLSGWNSIANFNETGSFNAFINISGTLHTFNMSPNSYLGYNDTTYIYTGYQNGTNQTIVETPTFTIAAFYDKTLNWTPLNNLTYYRLYNLSSYNKTYIQQIKTSGSEASGTTVDPWLYTLTGVDQILGYEDDSGGNTSSTTYENLTESHNGSWTESTFTTTYEYGVIFIPNKHLTLHRVYPGDKVFGYHCYLYTFSDLTLINYSTTNNPADARNGYCPFDYNLTKGTEYLITTKGLVNSNYSWTDVSNNSWQQNNFNFTGGWHTTMGASRYSSRLYNIKNLTTQKLRNFSVEAYNHFDGEKHLNYTVKVNNSILLHYYNTTTGWVDAAPTETGTYNYTIYLEHNGTNHTRSYNNINIAENGSTLNVTYYKTNLTFVNGADLTTITPNCTFQGGYSSVNQSTMEVFAADPGTLYSINCTEQYYFSLQTTVNFSQGPIDTQIEMYPISLVLRFNNSDVNGVVTFTNGSYTFDSNNISNVSGEFHFYIDTNLTKGPVNILFNNATGTNYSQYYDFFMDEGYGIDENFLTIANDDHYFYVESLDEANQPIDNATVRIYQVYPTSTIQSFTLISQRFTEDNGQSAIIRADSNSQLWVVVSKSGYNTEDILIYPADYAVGSVHTFQLGQSTLTNNWGIDIITPHSYKQDTSTSESGKVTMTSSENTGFIPLVVTAPGRSKVQFNTTYYTNLQTMTKRAYDLFVFNLTSPTHYNHSANATVIISVYADGAYIGTKYVYFKQPETVLFDSISDEILNSTPFKAILFVMLIGLGVLLSFKFPAQNHSFHAFMVGGVILSFINIAFINLALTSAIYYALRAIYGVTGE